jgi:hypothetical protein
MSRSAIRRALAAGLFALYALVAGVLVPLHLSMEAGESCGAGESTAGAADAGPDRSSFDASCGDPDCRNPAHHHHRAHTHDPATCSSCAQARAAASADPVAIAPAPEPAPAGRADAAPAQVVLDGVRALPNARGPPALS